MVRANLVIAKKAINSHHSFLFLAAQVIWWGMGISLSYDIAESLLHWPHWLAVILYTGLMIASTWFSVRVMILLGMLTLPGLFSIVYFSILDVVEGETIWALWSQLITLRSLEYLSWVLLLMGSFAAIGVSDLKSRAIRRKYTVNDMLALFGFGIGTAMMIFSGVNSAISNSQADILLILAMQGSNIIWVLGLARTSADHGHQVSISPQKIYFRWFLLLLGILTAVLYDWFSQYIVGWWQYPSVFLPPLAMMLVWMKSA